MYQCNNGKEKFAHTSNSWRHKERRFPLCIVGSMNQTALQASDYLSTQKCDANETKIRCTELTGNSVPLLVCKAPYGTVTCQRFALQDYSGGTLASADVFRYFEGGEQLQATLEQQSMGIWSLLVQNTHHHYVWYCDDLSTLCFVIHFRFFSW